MSVLQEFGGTVIDTVGDVVGAIGDNFANTQDERAARINAINTQVAINRAQAAANIETRKAVQGALLTTLYIGLGLAALAGIFWIVKTMKPK